TFADVPAGELLVYEDADRRLAVAVNQGSAVQRLGISVGSSLRIAPA
ncbi:MAG: SAM-dependent chlorinase/fluorinase, partial [Solirubrobacterales bacterium]|nr:SAM-dependent chlorinase/fluorinase [Solirubrobacterales bacterium]